MSTESVTPIQYGAAGLFLTIVAGCLAQGVTGIDLLAYLTSGALVTIAAIVGDVLLRRGRIANADQVMRAKAVHAAATIASRTPTEPASTDA